MACLELFHPYKWPYKWITGVISPLYTKFFSPTQLGDLLGQCVSNRGFNDVKSGVWLKIHMSNEKLGGGFKDFLFSPLFGEDSQFDNLTNIFQMG